MNADLPPPSPPGDVDAGLLVASLRDKTQCYKILMLRALVAELAGREGTFVSYADLAARMAEAAFWPIRLYRLRIGLDDRLSSALDDVGAIDARKRPDLLRAEFRTSLGDQRSNGFLHYVPQRLLRPWYDRAAEADPMLARDPDRYIRDTSGELRDDLRLLYGQVRRGREDGVDVLPAWRSYFLENIAIVQGWLDLQWIDWLQTHNPGVALPLAKTAPAEDRRSLERQRRTIAAAVADRSAFPDGVPCVYTNCPFAWQGDLDHFAPWSFVAHDAIWNLVPIGKSLNASKGARFPDEKFVPALADFHARVIRHLVSRSPRDDASLQEYAAGLRLGSAALGGDPAAVPSAYAALMDPMFMIARSMGFSMGWSPA